MRRLLAILLVAAAALSATPALAQPCEPIPAAGGVVDDFGPCMELMGNPDFWRVVDTGGWEDRFHWTNAFVSDTPGNWARWSLDFAEAGLYQVEANVVDGYNISTRARYMVRADGEETVQEVDQSAVTDWFSLGEFRFAAGGNQVVELYDNTGETLSDQHLTVDAVRLTRLDQPANNNGSGTNNSPLNNAAGNNANQTHGGNNGNSTGAGSEFGADDIRVNDGCCATLCPRSRAPVAPVVLVMITLWRRRRPRRGRELEPPELW